MIKLALIRLLGCGNLINLAQDLTLTPVGHCDAGCDTTDRWAC